MVPEALKIQPLLEPLENNLKQTVQQHSNWSLTVPLYSCQADVGSVTAHAKD